MSYKFAIASYIDDVDWNLVAQVVKMFRGGTNRDEESEVYIVIRDRSLFEVQESKEPENVNNESAKEPSPPIF